MDINNDILEAVRKNLPAQVGESLQKELAALAELRKSHATLNKEYDKLAERTKSLENELRRHGDLVEKENSINKREDAVEQRERNAELTELRTKHEAIVQQVQLAERLFEKAFRNPQFQSAAFGSVPVSHPNFGVSTHPYSMTTTTEAK